VDGAFNAGVVGWPEMAEPALGADEQAVASSRATRVAVMFRMSFRFLYIDRYLNRSYLFRY
tara:strand:- start:231 stop:413 length:183 start_codon:yes stop_codon:yes gene_type:complete